jgi:hypothetical protein
MKLRNPITRQTVTGPFAAQTLPTGVWQLTGEGASGPQIHLRGVGPEAPRLLAPISRLTVEWRADGVLLTLTGADGVHHLKAGSAIIHQPQPRLYESLPLARFDAAAQRFWRRIFRLIRIPGGRWLVALIARRNRKARSK